MIVFFLSFFLSCFLSCFIAFLFYYFFLFWGFLVSFLPFLFLSCFLACPPSVLVYFLLCDWCILFDPVPTPLRCLYGAYIPWQYGRFTVPSGKDYCVSSCTHPMYITHEHSVPTCHLITHPERMRQHHPQTTEPWKFNGNNGLCYSGDEKELVTEGYGR